MRLQFLGTGGYHPTERRHTSCVLLPEAGVAFDAGTSVFRVPACLEQDQLDLYLSHAHLDHVVGLTYFIVPLITGSLRRLRVYGREQDLDAVKTHLFSQQLFPVPPGFEFQVIEERHDISQGGVLTHVPLRHPGGSVGYRIDWPDRSLAYITDTMANSSYIDFIRGVDLLIHECNFPDEMQQWCETTGHSHTTAVTELARDAGVGRLFLTHFDPQSDADDPVGLETARAIFPETEIAEDQLTVEF